LLKGSVAPLVEKYVTWLSKLMISVKEEIISALTQHKQAKIR
jgi:hypothetical protein